MQNKLITISPNEYGLDKKNAEELTKGLNVPLKERDLLIKEFNKTSKLEVNEENVPIFRDLRLRIVKNRTLGIVLWHKLAKDYFLKGGQFVDAIKRKEVVVNEQMEEKLMDAEKHFEILEQKRYESLQKSREVMIEKYVEDASLLDLAGMDADVWNVYLSVKKQAYNDQIKVEKKAEEDRIAKEKAEAKERERIRKENEQLKKDAETKAKQDEKDRKERERVAQIEQDKRDKIEKERLFKLEAERKKREKVEVERLKTERIERKKREEEDRIRMANELKKQKEHEAQLEVERKKQEKIRQEAERKTTDKAIIDRFVKMCEESINPDSYNVLIDEIVPELKKNRKL